MNIILLNEDEISDGIAIVKGVRLNHILGFIRPEPGDTLRAGVLNGKTGTGRVISIDGEGLVLSMEIDSPPPLPAPLKLVIAMPRPKVLNRIIEHSTAMGIKEIYIIKTWRVEKSYWDSPVLNEENISRRIRAGLEQGKDTIPPEIIIRKRFKPFLEDELPGISEGTLKLAAHPAAADEAPRGITGEVTLAIGPEGGFIQYEIDALKSIGFTPVSLGERILRVETAIPYLVGRLF